MNQKVSKANEMFFVVDEDDNPLPALPRRLVHDHGVWHRVAHIWILNTAGQILCQQRSLMKELNPGTWEPFFGGHLRPGEDYLGEPGGRSLRRLVLQFLSPSLNYGRFTNIMIHTTRSFRLYLLFTGMVMSLS